MNLVLSGSFDVLVTEATIAGCAAALHLAGSGLRVALAAAGTSPGLEYAGCLRGWIDRRALGDVAEPFRGLFEKNLTGRGRDEDAEFHLGNWTQTMEDLLLDAGVRLFYRARPAGGLVDGEGLPSGVLLAGKFGLNAVLAKFLVDANPYSTVARCFGVPFAPRGSDGLVRLRHSFLIRQQANTGGDLTDIAAAWPAADGLVERHGRYVEVSAAIPVDIRHPLSGADIALSARERALSLLDQAPWRPDGAALLLSAEWPLVEPALRMENSAARTDAVPDLDGATERSGLFVLGPNSNVSDRLAGALWDASQPAAAINQGLRMASALAGLSRVSAASEKSEFTAVFSQTPGSAAEFTDAGDAGFGDPGYRTPGGRDVSVRLPPVPVMRQAKLFVAGLGTSGYTAACAAAEAGMPVLAVEGHGDVGGVHTVGGVPTYWFGCRTDFFKRFECAWQDRTAGRGLPLTLAMLDVLLESGCKMLLDTPMVGVAAESRLIKRVFLSGAGGLMAVGVDQIVDATGDGDLAAWAGAGYRYGRNDDESTMWCSFAKFQDHRQSSSRLYGEIVDQRSAADTTRAIVGGRRMTGIFGPAEIPQACIAVRESRHIEGRGRLSLADMLTGRLLSDSVLTFRSNFDLKGMAGDDLSLCGFVEPGRLVNFTCDLPLSALQPRDLENVLVIGRAYDCDHDAFAMARMQPDFIAMGGVAAVVAEHAVRHGIPVSQICPADVLPSIHELGIMREHGLWDASQDPEGLASEPPQRVRVDADGAADRIRRGCAGVADHVSVIESGERGIAVLRRIFRETEGPIRITAARLLAYAGDGLGIDVLLAYLDNILAEENMPGLPKEQLRRHGAPDHAWAPEPVYVMNTLARSGEQRLAGRLRRLADRLYFDPTVSDHRFHYAFAIAFAGLRMPMPEIGEAAAVTAGRNGVAGRRLGPDADLRVSSDPIGLRYAFLELSLGRAMYRCGHSRGAEILRGYLEDIRVWLARSAAMELAREDARTR